MNQANFIRALREGYFEGNLLIQITSHVVVDDMEYHDQYPDPEDNYRYPLLSAHDGVLKIAQRRYVEPDGTIYNAGIGRCTGLGEVFNDLKIGASNNVAGSLDFQGDDSLLMLEAQSIDWLSDGFEVRLSLDGTAWDLAEPIFEGIVLNGSEKDGKLSFRVSSINQQLGESLRQDYWLGNNSTIRYKNIIFGRILRMPIDIAFGLKDGDYFVYGGGSSGYKLNDPATAVAIKDQYGGWVPTAHVYYNDQESTLTGSDTWDLLENDTPDKECFADVNGYDEPLATYPNTRKIGAILKEIVRIAKTVDEDLNVVPILDGRVIDTASLDVLQSKTRLYSGINLLGYDLYHDSPSFPWEGIQVRGTPFTWLTLFTKYCTGSLALFTVNRDGSISFHTLMDTPIETPVVTITHADFEKFDKQKVINYQDVVQDDSFQKDYNEIYQKYPERVAFFEGEFLTMNDTSSTQYTNARGDILGRFGEQDYRFHGIPLAKAMNIGDVVTFGDDIDDYLDGTKTGYVTAIDRGTAPFLEVRA